MPKSNLDYSGRFCSGITLVEVMISLAILSMILLGVLQGSLQSRRLTEGSIRQASVASLVQGYLEQFKSVPYANLGVSPATTPGTGIATDWAAANVATANDSSQATITFCLAAGAAPTALPLISTLPVDASLHTEFVDIDNASSLTDNTTLSMWVWINDLSGGSVANCKSIVIVYQWTVRDGGRVRSYRDMVRSIRSAVPTT